jgi:hypothetical protein
MKTEAPASRINRFHFDELPTATQQRLLDRQQNVRTDQFKFQNGGSLGSWFLVVLAAVWFVALLLLANDYRWDSSTRTFYVVLTVLAAMVLSYAVCRIVRYRRARLKKYIYVTPLYVIKTWLDEVTFWSLSDLADFNVVHNHTNGSYANSTVNMLFMEGKETFVIHNGDEAQRLAQTLPAWGERFSQAQARGDWAYFAALDDFANLQTTGERAPRASTPGVAPWLARLAGVTLAGLLLGAAAVYLNDYLGDRKSWNDARAIDRSSSYRQYLASVPGGRWRAEALELSDRKAWEEAKATNRASKFREYMEQYPQGRYVEEASAAIARSYDDSAKRYVEERSAGFDRQASDAVLAVLNHAKTTRDYHVRVAFERRNEISEDSFVSGIRKKYGPLTLISMGDSFSDAKMKSREESILREVKEAFAEIIPDDVLEFTSAGDGSNIPVFVVSYSVKTGEMLYYRDSDQWLPETSRPYYPGISFDWDFAIRMPVQGSAPYSFVLQSKPSTTIHYRSDSLSASASSERSTIYDSMAESAFVNFRSELVRRLGLQTSNLAPAR